MTLYGNLSEVAIEESSIHSFILYFSRNLIGG